MADLDYGELRIYPGDYDDYMEPRRSHANACCR